jgi:quinoprotein glucose dehydrogenase
MRKVHNTVSSIALASLILSAGSLLGSSSLQAQEQAAASEWTTYGGNLASQRYSALDQINADNFKDLQIAWRLHTNSFGPRPETLYSSTPLYVNGMLYTTVGTRRAVVALDPATGEQRWMYSEDEGVRGSAGARQGAGRGLSWWASADGSDERIIYVTPGYRMIALDAKTGRPVPGFGDAGVVDLKQNFDQEIDPDGGNIGLNDRGGCSPSSCRRSYLYLGCAWSCAWLRRTYRRTSVDLPHDSRA